MKGLLSAVLMFTALLVLAGLSIDIRECGAEEGLFGVDAKANPEAVAEAVHRRAASSSGGEVVFPRGRWRIGPFHLRPNVFLRLVDHKF